MPHAFMRPMHSMREREFNKYRQREGLIFFHLYPQRFHGGTRRRQVLQVSRPLISEHRPGGFVVAVPLDGPAAVQEVLVRVVASQRKEIAGLSHLLDADVAGSFGNQANVDVTCRTSVGVWAKNQLIHASMPRLTANLQICAFFQAFRLKF